MKRRIAFALILTMMLTMAACGKKDPAPTTAAPTEAPTVATEAPTVPATTEAVEVPTVTAKPLYGEILDNYFDALLQGLEPADYMDRGLNYLPGMVKDVTKVGYSLEDLDGDGTSELLIGAVDENYIYALYSVVNGEEVMVLSATERNTYQIGSDGVIVNRGSNSAASYGYNLYSFAGGKLTFQDALVCDASMDEKNPWFYTKDEAWASENLEPLDTESAEAIEAQLTGSLRPISYMPFANYND